MKLVDSLAVVTINKIVNDNNRKKWKTLVRDEDKMFMNNKLKPVISINKTKKNLEIKTKKKIKIFKNYKNTKTV